MVYHVDMDHDWISLSQTKEIKTIANGRIVVIRPTDKLVVPIFCPSCTFPMSDSLDFLSFKEYKCCQHCELKFARTNPAWKEGWRPDVNSTSWTDYIKLREELYRPAIKFL